MKVFVFGLFMCLTTLSSAQVLTTLKQPELVALVNGWPLPQVSFDELSSALLTADPSNTRTNILEGIITRRILAQYLDDHNLTPKLREKPLKEATEDILARLPNLTQEQQQAIRVIVKDQQIQQKYLHQIGAINNIHSAKTAVMFAAKNISQQAVEAYYASHLDRFKQIGQIQAQHIQLTSQVQADQVYKTLQQGMPFSDAVKKWSVAKDKSLPLPGDLGILKNGDIELTLTQKIALLQPVDKVSRPFRTRDGWHIYWVRSQTHEVLALDGSVALTIRILLAKQQIRHNHLSTLQKTIQEANIQLNHQHFKGDLFHD